MTGPLAALERVSALEVDRARAVLSEAERNLAHARAVLRDHEHTLTRIELTLRKARQRGAEAKTAEDLFASERYALSLRADAQAVCVRLEGARKRAAEARLAFGSAQQALLSLEAKRRAAASARDRAAAERERLKNLSEEELAEDMHRVRVRTFGS